MNEGNIYKKYKNCDDIINQKNGEKPTSEIISDGVVDFTMVNFPELASIISPYLTEEQYFRHKEMLSASADFDIFEES